jgi:hypothetical protein
VVSHQTYIQTIRAGDGGYFAVCVTCGADLFPNRETQGEAERDAQAHRVAQSLECAIDVPKTESD